MKRLTLVLAVLSLSSLVYAQEAEKDGFAADFSVVSRLEVNGIPAESGVNLGSSALYLQGDGQFTKNLSFSFMLNPLNSEPADLYNTTFRSDSFNWLNWASLTYSFGDFSITAGKSYFYTATFEEDEYDYDSYSFLNTSVWNNFPIYQWGVQFGWQLSESFNMNLSAFTSPYGDHPFSSNRFGFAGVATMELSDMQAKVGASLMQDGAGDWFPLLSAGVTASVGPLSMTDDFYSKACDETLLFVDGFSNVFSCKYQQSETWNLALRFATDYYKTSVLNGFDYRIGLVGEYFPLDGLRVHALAGYETGAVAEGFAFTAGLTYTFSFSL